MQDQIAIFKALGVSAAFTGDADAAVREGHKKRISACVHISRSMFKNEKKQCQRGIRL